MKNQEAQIIEELSEIGFPVTSVSDLFNKRMMYRRAIPLLLKWLPIAEQPTLKEEIVRALTVKWAKPSASSELIRLFKSVDDPSGLGLRWAIANALSVTANESVAKELVQIAENVQYGRAREMIVVALGTIIGKTVDDVLIKLLDDEEVVGHALIAIRKRRLSEASAKVKHLLDHEKAWVRKEASKTLAALSR
jgi:HEAT repeat protein